MNIKFVVLATTFLLTTGCASNGSTSSGSSSAGTQQSSEARPAGRTRAEVNAEAVETVKHYKSTQSQERDWFNPYAQ